MDKKNFSSTERKGMNSHQRFELLDSSLIVKMKFINLISVFSLHKKPSFPLMVSSVDVTKSAFLKYVWPFFIIMLEKVDAIITPENMDVHSTGDVDIHSAYG